MEAPLNSLLVLFISGNHFVLTPIFMTDRVRFGHVTLSCKEPIAKCKAHQLMIAESINTCTRHRDLLCLPLAKTTNYQGSFWYNAACTFNSLPASVRSLRAGVNSVQAPGKTPLKTLARSSDRLSLTVATKCPHYRGVRIIKVEFVWNLVSFGPEVDCTQ